MFSDDGEDYDLDLLQAAQAVEGPSCHTASVSSAAHRKRRSFEIGQSSQTAQPPPNKCLVNMKGVGTLRPVPSTLLSQPASVCTSGSAPPLFETALDLDSDLDLSLEWEDAAWIPGGQTAGPATGPATGAATGGIRCQECSVPTALRGSSAQTTGTSDTSECVQTRPSADSRYTAPHTGLVPQHTQLRPSIEKTPLLTPAPSMLRGMTRPAIPTATKHPPSSSPSPHHGAPSSSPSPQHGAVSLCTTPINTTPIPTAQPPVHMTTPNHMPPAHMTTPNHMPPPSLAQPFTHITTPNNMAPPSNQTSAATATPSSTGSSKRRRKFPGPAGALPKLAAGRVLSDVALLKPAAPRTTPHTPQPVDLPSSQTSEEQFTSGPWTRMLADLEPQAAQLLQDYSIAELLAKAQLRHLPRGKAPVICALIDTVSLQHSEALVLLKDPTGEMQGTVHRQLLREYPEHITVGTVLVLRQVGVFSPSLRRHYLNITPSNLVRLYSRGEDGAVAAVGVAEFTPQDLLPPPPVVPPPLPAAPPAPPHTGADTPSHLFTTRGTPCAPVSCVSTRLVKPSTPANSRLIHPSNPANSRLIHPSTPANSRLIHPSTPTNSRMIHPSTPANSRLIHPSSSVQPSTPASSRLVQSCGASVQPSTPASSRLVQSCGGSIQPSTPTNNRPSHVPAPGKELPRDITNMPATSMDTTSPPNRKFKFQAIVAAAAGTRGLVPLAPPGERIHRPPPPEGVCVMDGLWQDDAVDDAFLNDLSDDLMMS